MMHETGRKLKNKTEALPPFYGFFFLFLASFAVSRYDGVFHGFVLSVSLSGTSVYSALRDLLPGEINFMVSPPFRLGLQR